MGNPHHRNRRGRIRWILPDPDDWNFNDTFYLRYPFSHRFSHRFYTGPPNDPLSTKISPAELHIPKDNQYQIREVIQTQRNGHTYVAARFQFHFRYIWTNLAKNDHVWAYKHDGFRAG